MINISWYEKYRPKSIEDFVFNNDEQRRLVEHWIQQEKIDGNVLFSGAAGTGKTTLAIILIQHLVKSQNDLYRMQSRSVQEIDEQIRPFVVKRPVKSKSKIIYIEEIDRISKQGQTQLKEDLMEKYQEYVSFIACSNYPKRIDNALLTRFTYKLDFTSSNIDGIYNRLKFILDSENAKYDENDLRDYVQKSHKLGLRNLINNLQIAYIDNPSKIDFSKIRQSISIEDNVIQLFINIIGKVMKIADITERKLCLISPFNSQIAAEYQELVSITHNNYDINYNDILEKLYQSVRYLPLQIIIGRYSEDIDMKKYPHLHLISCLYECIKCVLEVNM